MIIVDKVRVENFRSLKALEINLEKVTILAGANNSGKTTFLRCLNLLFGANKFQPTRDDLYINAAGDQPSQCFCIDARIVPVNSKGQRIEVFADEWLGVFGGEGKVDEVGDFFAVRYKVQFSGRGDRYKTSLYTIADWENPAIAEEEDELPINLSKSISLYYIDAQRDLSHDVKLRHSYFGRLAAHVNDSFDDDGAAAIVALIKELNEQAIDRSEVLKHLRDRLSELNQTTVNGGGGVSISPFSASVRDLHKGMKVNFQDGASEKFSLEYHGMGTRSWASLLSFKAFTSWEILSKEEQNEAYFPILALEEPEAHLHPNAQKTLYSQLCDIGGQKIISTHSPYVVAQANLNELRHLNKVGDECVIKQLYFSDKEEEEIKALRQEIVDAGGTPEIHQQNQPIISQLKESCIGKLGKEDQRKISRAVLNTRGELLFAKAFVLFEGETEEQALPILAKEYFGGQNAFDFGISFVGVGGKNSYAPFLNMAKFLDIPVFILSDGDGNTEAEVKAILEPILGNGFPDLYVLDTHDFEGYLISHGFQTELTAAVNKCRSDDYFPDTYCVEQNGGKRKGGGLKTYLDQQGVIIPQNLDIALLDCLHSGKTEFATYIADAIVEAKDADGNCRMPPKVLEMLDSIKQKLNR